MPDPLVEPVREHGERGSYTIQVLGEVERHWELELQMGLTYCRTETGTISTLSGPLPDQAALLGALQWLSMWGYVILAVKYLPGTAE